MGRDPIRPQPPGPVGTVGPYVPTGRPLTPNHKPGQGVVGLHKVVGHEMTITPEGPRIVITGHIEDVEGDPWLMLINAASNPLVPKLWDYHPVMTDLPLTNIQIRPLSDSSPNTAHVTLTYAYTSGGTGFINPPDSTSLPQIEISTTVQGKTTHFWKETIRNGDYYTFNSNQILVYETADDFNATPKRPQTKSATYYEPMTVIRYSRREPPVDAHGRTPGQKSRIYTGCVNLDTVFGDPAGYWLCTGIVATTDDAGASYNVSYSFQYNVDSWDNLAIATKTVDGIVTDEIVFVTPANDEFTTLKKAIYPGRIFSELDLYMNR